jgi:ATPase family AAA domain-containing protein 3A/B
MKVVLDYENEKVEKYELLVQNHMNLLQQKRIELENQYEQSKANIEIEKIKAEIEAKALQERMNEDVTIRRIQMEAQLNTQKMIDIIKIISTHILQIISDILSEPYKIFVFLGFIFLLFVLYYSFIQMVQVVREFVQSKLGKPKLIRETSYAKRHYIIFPILTRLFQFFQSKSTIHAVIYSKIKSYFDEVILSEEVLDKVLQLAISTHNTKATGTPYRHVLFHGPPGTGKTLVGNFIHIITILITTILIIILL